MPMLCKRLPYLFSLLLVAVAGCGALRGPQAEVAFFDLGFAAHTEPPAFAPAKVDVRAPSWLSSTAMQYRLDYRQPAQREAYSETRWVSEPAEMLRLALDRALTGNAADEGECRLSIDLDEFVQIFDAAKDSHARIAVRAKLASRDGAEIARRVITVDEPAPTPDAAGGVIAYRRALQRLANELSSWLTHVAAGAGRESDAGAAGCERRAPAVRPN